MPFYQISIDLFILFENVILCNKKGDYAFQTKGEYGLSILTDSLAPLKAPDGTPYEYIFFPLSGHGLLLDPWSEVEYYDALYSYCETYFGY